MKTRKRKERLRMERRKRRKTRRMARRKERKRSQKKRRRRRRRQRNQQVTYTAELDIKSTLLLLNKQLLFIFFLIKWLTAISYLPLHLNIFKNSRAVNNLFHKDVIHISLLFVASVQQNAVFIVTEDKEAEESDRGKEKSLAKIQEQEEGSEGESEVTQSTTPMITSVQYNKYVLSLIKLLVGERTLNDWTRKG